MCKLVPDVCANRMLNADATAGCNHVVILHGEMTAAWLAAGSTIRAVHGPASSETTYVGKTVFSDDCCPTLRIEILRERWRASRLPSLCSALRGLDPHHALPMFWHLSERRQITCIGYVHLNNVVALIEHTSDGGP